LALNHLSFSPDGQWLASASMDKTLKIWNAQTLKLLKVVDYRRHAAHTSSVNRALWLHDSEGIITCSDDRQVLGWHLQFLPEAYL
jgi:WD40 repeat protein